jgi:hypothetical protein
LNGGAPDLEKECRRYSALLAEASIDVGFFGIGEKGHTAFNDPPVADFTDPRPINIVRLDDACRLQQVGEGHFPDISTVPEGPLSLTCSAILGAVSLNGRLAPFSEQRVNRPERFLYAQTLCRAASESFTVGDLPDSMSLRRIW